MPNVKLYIMKYVDLFNIEFKYRQTVVHFTAQGFSTKSTERGNTIYDFTNDIGRI